MRGSIWFAFVGLLFLVVGFVFARGSWEGWVWPEDVSLAQHGAELEGAIFIVGANLAFGTALVLNEVEGLRRDLRRSSGRRS